MTQPTRILLVLAFVLALLGPREAPAQTRAAPESRSEVQLSFAPVVRRAAPAVVNVYGARVERARQRESMDDFFRRFFGEDGPGMPRERMQRSLGSGVIVDPTGLVVTNHHVIENMTEVKVALNDRREFEAEIVLRDQRTDLAVLRLKGASALPAIEFGDSEKLEVGDLVLAIGNPFGVGQTVTQGIVSALARTQVGVTDYQFFIQTDAAINPGNSGGALVDIGGRVIGINTAIFSRSGGSHGIGFAIPAGMVRAVVESARGGARTVRRPWLGAKLQSVDRDLAESIGLERPMGVLVAAVFAKGPADEAGLRRNDVIVELDGQAIDDPDAFGYRFALKGLGGETDLTVMRGAKRTAVRVRLQTPPETRPREPVRVRSRSPLAGVTAVNLSPAVADELRLDVDVEGVAIAEVDEGSAASRVGFRKGDLILAINGERVSASRDVERLIRGGGGTWRITINRGGQVLTSVLGG
ncbi:MAG TPA: DegQ family serine endoprotease [Beijerinckiaceae bacterium]|nr:DegQ family serine endoprotease [Beijerinckiaceae bacterium]